MNEAEKENRSVGFLLSDVTGLLRKHFDRRAERLGLTRAQWRALKRLHYREGVSQSELAELLEMEPIAIGRVIDRLQQAGFVERRADPADRRRWQLYLTDRAHAVIDDMDVISKELQAEATAGISATQLAALNRALLTMKDNLQAMDLGSVAE